MASELNEDYDVVVDALQKHRDALWKITNANSEWGAMDFIRMEQIQILDAAIKERKESTEKHYVYDR